MIKVKLPDVQRDSFIFDGLEKGKKIICKITDKSGIDEVNGKKISKKGKIVKSYTVKGDCVVSDLAGNESVSYSFK